MTELKIRILGHGGCLNKGLPYNACLINEHFLLEAPPDIMVSILRPGLDFEKIDTIFISHLHGDHTFGLPFIIINKWMTSLEDRLKPPLVILGPPGIERHTKKITAAAFTTSHPCYEWLEKNIRFETAGLDFKMTLGGLSLSCFDLRHPVETYGLAITVNNENIFAYIADTSWCRRVEQVLAGKPKLVLMDMNGGNPDIHISLDEVIEKGLPITGNETLYVGTHLAEEFDPPRAGIRCARPGEVIWIG